jgi:hypothetical protein
MTEDQLLRALLATLAFIALLLSGMFFGTIWPERGWPIKVVCIGLGLILLYLFAGQIKSFNLGIPFDGVSWLGLIGYTVLVFGLGWFIHDRHPRRDR